MIAEPTEAQRLCALHELAIAMERRGFIVSYNSYAISIRLDTTHRNSNRREGFLFQQNCATIDEALGAMRMYEHLVSVGAVPVEWPATP